jgi:hypothetical protein
MARIRFAILTLSLSFALYSQTQQIAAIDSGFAVTIPTIPGLSFTAIGNLASLTVSYPTGLTPGSYLSPSQLNTDFQSFLASYPSRQDPPEAILSTVLQSIVNKYPQMTGGRLTVALAGNTTVNGIPVPLGAGSVAVAIGTFNTAGVVPLSRRTAKPRPSPSR